MVDARAALAIFGFALASLVSASPATGSPSLLCFTVVVPFGSEPGLLRSIAERHLGMFDGCDAVEVFSNESLVTESSMHLIEGSMKVPRGGQFNSVLNEPVFAKVWRNIYKAGAYKNYDWIVKVDSDVVWYPNRMREVIADACAVDVENPHRCSIGALASCGKTLSPGPVQIISRAALETFMQNFSTCQARWSLEQWGEDLWLDNCFQLLKIPLVDAAAAVNNNECGNPLLVKFMVWVQASFPQLYAYLQCDGYHAAFHSFKQFSRWQECRYWSKGARMNGYVRGAVLLVLVFGCVVVARCFMNNIFSRKAERLATDTATE